MEEHLVINTPVPQLNKSLALFNKRDFSNRTFLYKDSDYKFDCNK